MSKLFSKSISMLCRRFSSGNIVWKLKYLLTDRLQDSELIVPGDSALIRKYESDESLLWFYDTQMAINAAKAINANGTAWRLAATGTRSGNSGKNRDLPGWK